MRARLDAYARKLSRSFFGNTVDPKFNITGSLKRAELALRRKYPRTPQSDEFDNTGYLPLKPVDRSIMETIRAKYLAMIDNPESSEDNANKEAKRLGVSFSRIIWDVFDKIPEAQFVVTDEVREVVRAHYGRDFIIHRSSAWRTEHIPEQYKTISAYSNRWHNDNRPTQWCKIFVHLQDITEADGPFHTLSRSDSDFVLRSGFKNRRNYGLPDETIEDLAYRSVGPLGSILLSNTEWCMHRAGVPERGHHRDMIEVFFSPA